MSASPWTLDSHVAQLHLDAVRATIDLRDPAGGLQDLRLAQSPLGANLLGVLMSAGVETRAADEYVRCEDLVATYPQLSDRAMRVQTYWRCQPHPSQPSIELQVSVQTDELGVATPVVAYSQVEIAAVSRLVDARRNEFAPLSLALDELMQLTPQDATGCLLFEFPSSDWCYAQMIHPADFQRDQLGIHRTARGSRRAILEHRLFPGELEKGVILRCRIRGVFARRDNPATAIAEAYRQFLRDPLPLTT